jgi:hypothetical protein
LPAPFCKVAFDFLHSFCCGVGIGTWLSRTADVGIGFYEQEPGHQFLQYTLPPLHQFLCCLMAWLACAWALSQTTIGQRCHMHALPIACKGQHGCKASCAWWWLVSPHFKHATTPPQPLRMCCCLRTCGAPLMVPTNFPHHMSHTHVWPLRQYGHFG